MFTARVRVASSNELRIRFALWKQLASNNEGVPFILINRPKNKQRLTQNKGSKKIFQSKSVNSRS